MCILTNCTVHLYNVWLGWPAAPQRAEALDIHIYIYMGLYIYINKYDLYIYMYVHTLYATWFTMCQPEALRRALAPPARGTKPLELCVYCIPCAVCPGQSGNQSAAHILELPQHQQLLRTTSHSQSKLSNPVDEPSISGAPLPIPGV
jgi:hypothetical protein